MHSFDLQADSPKQRHNMVLYAGEENMTITSAILIEQFICSLRVYT
jgi:hypothetical protein